MPPANPSFDQVNRMEELLFAVGMDNIVALVPEFVRNNITGNMCFLELDMPNPPMFRMSADILPAIPTPPCVRLSTSCSTTGFPWTIDAPRPNKTK